MLHVISIRGDSPSRAAGCHHVDGEKAGKGMLGIIRVA
jgi:hypothetical protein